MVHVKISGLLVTSLLLLLVTIAHLIIYTASLDDPLPEAICTVGSDCPSWMIPNNAVTYLILAILEITFLLASMTFIFSPYKMLRTNTETPTQIAIRAAFANISTSALLPMWLISSLLSIASTRGYPSKFTDNFEYSMYIAAVVIFIVFDLGYIFLVAGVNQLFVSRVRSVRQLRKFRAAVLLIALRLAVSIAFLFVQFFVDYVSGNEGTASAMTVATYAAFTMMLIMMLYKIYMVQLLLRKAVHTKEDFFALEAGRFNIVDESGWWCKTSRDNNN